MVNEASGSAKGELQDWRASMGMATCSVVLGVDCKRVEAFENPFVKRSDLAYSLGLMELITLKTGRTRGYAQGRAAVVV